MSSIIDMQKLIKDIRDYEPAIVRIIFDYVFLPCYKDQEVKHKYIRALPQPGTTHLCNDAFKNNTNLQMVIIDKSVKSIGVSAFNGCYSLKHVNIPNSIKTIGMWAFARCSSLTTVNIPGHLEKIVKENKVLPWQVDKNRCALET